MNDLRPFKAWCQKVLPLVYDDSLSYYEVLCKLISYLNNIINQTIQNTNDINALKIQVDKLENYVKNYFASLDVQEEINNKLDEMAESGELALILSNVIKTKAPIMFSFITPSYGDSQAYFINEYEGAISRDGQTFNAVKNMHNFLGNFPGGHDVIPFEFNGVYYFVCAGNVNNTPYDFIYVYTKDFINWSDPIYFNEYNVYQTLIDLGYSETLAYERRWEASLFSSNGNLYFTMSVINGYDEEFNPVINGINFKKFRQIYGKLEIENDLLKRPENETIHELVFPDNVTSIIDCQIYEKPTGGFLLALKNEENFTSGIYEMDSLDSKPTLLVNNILDQPFVENPFIVEDNGVYHIYSTHYIINGIPRALYVSTTTDFKKFSTAMVCCNGKSMEKGTKGRCVHPIIIKNETIIANLLKNENIDCWHNQSTLPVGTLSSLDVITRFLKTISLWEGIIVSCSSNTAITLSNRFFDFPSLIRYKRTASIRTGFTTLVITLNGNAYELKSINSQGNITTFFVNSPQVNQIVYETNVFYSYKGLTINFISVFTQGALVRNIITIEGTTTQEIADGELFNINAGSYACTPLFSKSSYLGEALIDGSNLKFSLNQNIPSGVYVFSSTSAYRTV